MANISASLVKELREKTGAGMMACKKALEETRGNLEEAINYLRIKGISDADKKTQRETGQGLVESYIHGGGKIGVLVEVNCETDFVARTEEFREFVKDIAMHICASMPKYISKDEVPPDVIENEKNIYIERAKESGKPSHILDKIVEGQIEKFLKGICLLTQDYVKNPDITIDEYIKEKIAKFGENIKVRRFVRYELGEE
jgi:elongation factor Ts